MTVELRPTFLLRQPAVFDPLLSGLRVGESLAVRVLTMVDKGVARLSILGQTMDVDTPLPLLDGAELMVTIAKDGKNLKLLVQSDLLASSSLATTDSLSLGQLKVAPGFWAGSAKSSINQAWLTGLSRGNEIPQILRGQPDGAEFQIKGQIRLRFEIEGGAGEAPETPQLANAGCDRFSLGEGQPDSVGHPQPEMHAPSVMKAHEELQVSVRLPDLVSPLLVRVMPEVAGGRADDEPKRNHVDDPQHRTWRVEFNIDTGKFGPLAISVQLNADNVSVKLRAEKGRSASPLSSVLPELRHALEMVDLTVEALNVELGKT